MSQHDDQARLRHVIVEPLLDLSDEERARLHAFLRQAEGELATGKGGSAADVLRELRTAK